MSRLRLSLSLVFALGWPLGGCGDGGGGQEAPAAGQLVTASGAAGERAASVSHPADGAPWAGTSPLTVPAGTFQLLVASVPDLDNADLEGVDIVLRSPDGAQEVRLGGGALAVSGLAEEDIADAALEADIDAYVAAIGAALPAGFGEADLLALAERAGAADPAQPLPQPPADLADRIAAYGESLRALQATVPRAEGARRPTDGLLVFGPPAGDWTVSVTVQAGAGPFEVRALVLPDGFQRTAVENLAAALAEQRPVAVKQAALEEPCTGCDPGCNQAIERWRHPAGGPEWERAMLLRAGWAVIETVAIAGGTAAVTALVVALVPEETLLAIAAVFALSPQTFVAVVTATVGIIIQALTDFENVAEDLYWRLAFTWWTPENYGTVCSFGLARESPAPPFELAPSDSLAPTVTVLNASRCELAYEGWGYGTAGNPRALTWETDREDVVTLTPRAETHGATCDVRAAADPPAEAATLTVTMETQPARQEFPVSIRERTCTLADVTLVFGDEADLFLTIEPPIPGSWTTEYEWTASDFAGVLTSPADGGAAPFTTTAPHARYTAGNEAGEDVVEVRVVHVAAGGGRETVCEALARVVVVADLRLEPDHAVVAAGESVILVCRGCDMGKGLVFVWETGGSCGALVGPDGPLVTTYETTTLNGATYTAAADAVDGATDVVSVTAYEVDISYRRKEVGFATAVVEVRTTVPPCEVVLPVYDAPAGWTWGDPNPNDVTCELAAGTWVIDPDSIDGCITAAPCQGHCDGYGDPVSAGAAMQWQTYDAEGNSTGGNHCGAPGGRGLTCEQDVAWSRRACRENFCEVAGDPEGGFACSPCNCACGGGNCYPWTGPGSIVFDAWTNVPCTEADIPECYYHQAPQQIRGTYSFTLVHCASVGNALPNCPGNEP